MTSLPLDANGTLPLGHEAAKEAAAKELLEMVNELPDSFYHLGPTDAEWIASNMLLRYLQVLLQQKRSLTLVGR